MSEHREAVVVGAGIAGASVAYFLGQAGVRVTVLDTNEHTASHVLSALINPVRGQSGHVDDGAVAGMRLTWQLIEELVKAGHPVPHGRTGVLRPIPDDKTRAKFERHLPADLKAEWLSPADVPVLSAGWSHVLSLPEGGWVDGRAFCEALIAASGAQRVTGRFDPGMASPTSVIFCGGSFGSTLAGERRTHRMGSMLLLDRAPSEVPLSFGAYLSPDAYGGVLGGTFEAPCPQWQTPQLPLASLDWLLAKGTALTDLAGLRVTGRWTGSRLSGLRCGRTEAGVWELSGLSSKGFLLGPLKAGELVRAWLQAPV